MQPRNTAEHPQTVEGRLLLTNIEVEPDPAYWRGQKRCQTITNARAYGGENSTAQCWFYNGHVGPHWFGGEDYADTVSRSLTGLPFDEARRATR